MAFGDGIGFLHVEQFEVGGAGPEARAMVVRLLDPIIGSLRRVGFRVPAGSAHLIMTLPAVAVQTTSIS
jgi:hypothetical protein